jgi:DnaK suppressor protein
MLYPHAAGPGQKKAAYTAEIAEAWVSLYLRRFGFREEDERSRAEWNRRKAIKGSTDGGAEVIVQRSHQREAIWVAQSNELMETVQLATERQFATRALKLENKYLMQVDAALKRIEDGEFGTCLECEEPISPKRLAAVPWATYCLLCQELNDSRQATEVAEPTLAA